MQVQLELVSGLCLRLRRQLEQIRRRIKDTEAERKKVHKQVSGPSNRREETKGEKGEGRGQMCAKSIWICWTVSHAALEPLHKCRVQL